MHIQIHTHTHTQTHTQIRMKPTTLSPVDTDANQQPVFGIHDVSTEKLKDQERERALFLEQLAMVSERQAIAREKGLRAQQEEADMLKRTRDRYTILQLLMDSMLFPMMVPQN